LCFILGRLIGHLYADISSAGHNLLHFRPQKEGGIISWLQLTGPAIGLVELGGHFQWRCQDVLLLYGRVTMPRTQDIPFGMQRL
jgi:hypothetical protein